MPGHTKTDQRKELVDFFSRDKELRDQEARVTRALQDRPSNVVEARKGFGEFFSTGLQIGKSQLETDFKRAQAIGNLFIGDDQAAAYRLSEARIIEAENEGLFKELEPFSEILEEPTFTGVTQQIGKAIGQFTPLAITSFASGFTGAATAVLGRGAFTASSRAGMKELFSGALKKKSLQQTLSPEEKLILETSHGISRFGVAGGLAGAFSQEQLIGSAQALAEFEDAGKEITVDEAAAATALGIPQAVLGTVSESLFAASLFKLAFRRSRLGTIQNKNKQGKKLSEEEQNLLDIAAKRQRGDFLTKTEDNLYREAINPGPYFANVMKDVANATAASSVAEGVTELGQEEILIQQRKAIDPEYSDQEAALRRAESAFAGFFAGGARSAVASPVSSIFRTAREQLQSVRENQAYANLREEQYGPMSGMPIPETEKQVDAQITALKQGQKNSMYVPDGTELSSDIKTKLRNAGVTDANSITVEGIGTFVTNNTDKFAILSKAQAENRLLDNSFLASFLDYSNVGRPMDDLVVIVKEPTTGEIIEQQTTDPDGVALAESNFRERYGPDVIIETVISEEAVADKKQSQDVEIRGEGGFTVDLDDPETQQAIAEGDLPNFAQELGIEETFGLSTAVDDETGFVLVEKDIPKSGKKKDDIDTYNIIPPEEFENYSEKVKTRITEKRQKVLDGLTAKREVMEGFGVEEAFVPQATKDLINTLNEGALNKYLTLIDRSPTADLSFVLGNDNKVRIRFVAQPGATRISEETELNVIQKAFSDARQDAYSDKSKTVSIRTESPEFAWFARIQNPVFNPDEQEVYVGRNTFNYSRTDKPLNMNRLLKTGRALWARETDPVTRRQFSYQQQLVLGLGTILPFLRQSGDRSDESGQFLTDSKNQPIEILHVDKTTGEVSNLAELTDAQARAIKIWYDPVQKKYLSLGELNLIGREDLDGSSLSVDANFADRIKKIAAKIVGANISVQGIQGRETFTSLRGEGIGTAAKNLARFDPGTVDLFRVSMREGQTITAKVAGRNIIVKNNDVVDSSIRSYILGEDTFMARGGQLATFTKIPEGEPILAKTGNVVSGVNYRDVADFIDEDFAVVVKGKKKFDKALFNNEFVPSFIERNFEGDFLKNPDFGAFEGAPALTDIDRATFIDQLERFAERQGVILDPRADRTDEETADVNVPGVGGNLEIEAGILEGLRIEDVPLTYINVTDTTENIQLQRDLTQDSLNQPSRRAPRETFAERKKRAEGKVKEIDVKGIRFSKGVAAMFTRAQDSSVPYEQRRLQGVDTTPAVLSGYKAVLDMLGLKRDSIVITSTDDSYSMNIEARFTTPDGKTIEGIGQVNNFIRKQQAELENSTDPENLAQILKFGNKDIVILKDFAAGELTNGNPKEDAVYRRFLSLGHEFGHSYLFQELDNIQGKPIFDRLYKAYEKAIAGENPPPSYLGKYGFEEFLSDQFSLASIERLNDVKPTTVEAGFFHKLVKKLETFFKSLTGFLQQRYGQGVTPEFNQFLQTTANRFKTAPAKNNAMGYLGEIEIRNAVGEIKNTVNNWLGGRKTINKLNKSVKDSMSTKDTTTLLEKAYWLSSFIFLPAHNHLLAQRKRVSSTKEKNIIKNLADQAYISSKERGRGYLNNHPNAHSEKVNELLSIPELAIEDPMNPTQAEMKRLNDVLLAAEPSVATTQLGPEAKAVRSFLQNFWLTVLKENDVGFRENFFPRALDIFELMANPTKQAALVDLLNEYNPKKANERNFSFEKVVAELIKEESDATLDNIEGQTEEAVSDVAVGSNRERTEYFKNIPNERLREIGVLKPPVESMLEYINSMIKRTEYNKAFKYPLDGLSPQARAVLQERDITFTRKAANPEGFLEGWKAVEAQLAEISDPKVRQEARNTMRAMIGKSDTTMKPVFRNVNSFFLTLNVVTYLTFAPLASFPDAAGPVLFSGDYRAVTQDLVKVVKEYASGKQGRDRLRKLSLDIGVNSASALHMFYVNAAEQNYVGPTARRIQDIFFKVTGLEGFTRFMRIYAAGMAEAFMIRAAEGAKEGDTVLARQLESLGLTPQEVEAWQKDGGDFSRHAKVKEAHAKFVDESLVRPNAAERPAWASSPYFALIWQLKSFFYAYGKNIMMGLYRTSKLRGQEAGLTAASAPLFLGMVTLLPLTMVGLELREFIKYLAGGGDAAKLRTNNMNWGEYSFEILDRSGTLGPFGLLVPAIEAERYGDEFWISPLGPTAERFEDLIQGEFKLKDITPVLSAL